MLSPCKYLIYVTILISQVKCQHFIPCIFIMSDCHQSILHGFIDQGVYAGHKEVDGAQQSLTILAQQLLCFCIIPKFILQGNTQVLIACLTPSNVDGESSMHL